LADIFTKRKRSEVMALARSTGNKSPELRFIALTRAGGITGWRRRQKLPGSPDFVFRKRRLAVFVDGCFSHSCPSHATIPATRRTFWPNNSTPTRAATAV
jgi:DNA mismatch endonuclease (patch repair protein)